jgi:hypothetical protein
VTAESFGGQSPNKTSFVVQHKYFHFNVVVVKSRRVIAAGRVATQKIPALRRVGWSIKKWLSTGWPVAILQAGTSKEKAARRRPCRFLGAFC